MINAHVHKANPIKIHKCFRLPPYPPAMLSKYNFVLGKDFKDIILI